MHVKWATGLLIVKHSVHLRWLSHQDLFCSFVALIGGIYEIKLQHRLLKNYLCLWCLGLSKGTSSGGLARLLLRYKGRLIMSIAGCPTAHQCPAVLRKWCNSTLCLPSSSQLWGTLQEKHYLMDGCRRNIPTAGTPCKDTASEGVPPLALLFSCCCTEVGFHYSKEKTVWPEKFGFILKNEKYTSWVLRGFERGDTFPLSCLLHWVTRDKTLTTWSCFKSWAIQKTPFCYNNF